MATSVRNVVDAAGTRWVALALVLPLAATVVAGGLRSVAAVNLVHVGAGAVWIGAAVYVGAILGPSLLAMEPEVRGAVLAGVIPRSVTLFVGVGVASLVTGPMLAVAQGRWDLGAPLMALAVLLGLGLLVVGTYLVRLQVLAFSELAGEGPPDPDRMAAIGGKLGRASPVVVALQLAVLLVMVLLRAPGGV